MATLYGVCRSRASRAMWLAGELGITLDEVPVIQAYRLPDPAAPGAPLNTRSPEFLALSPAGAIPVLKDGDLVLSESLAINHYLAQKHGGPVAPADAAEAALTEQWAFYAATAIEPHALAILYVVAQGRADSAEGQAELAREAGALERPLAVLEAHLAKDGHMVGGRFTVADIDVAEIVRYAQPHPTLLQGYPAITAWLKACHARPAFQAMWARRNAEPA